MRFQTIQFGRRQQTLNRGGTTAGALTACKKPILFAHRYRPDAVFHRVVVKR